MVLKCEYQGLPTGVYKNLNILGQGIQTPPVFFKAMCIIVDARVLTKTVFKRSKTLKENSKENCGGGIKKIQKNPSFGHRDIDYFWDSNDEVRSLSPK